MLKLYYHPNSTFARRVRMALIEKNIAAELVEVDMAARAHRAAAYLALNPYGRVPTLEEEGFVLCESTAILELWVPKIRVRLARVPYAGGDIFCHHRERREIQRCGWSFGEAHPQNAWT